MKQLKATLLGIDCQNVETYIQSGNVVLQHAQSTPHELSQLISGEIQRSYGFQPRILVLTLAEFQQAAANNPFQHAQAVPKTLHLYFLAAPVEKANFELMHAIKKDNESFELIGQVFYLHAPDGIGRSKLAEKVEKLLAVQATARNWSTVSKLMVLASQN